jgi:hypothetical protein
VQFWDAKFNKNKADHRFRVTLILRYVHFTIVFNVVFGLLLVIISRNVARGGNSRVPWKSCGLRNLRALEAKTSAKSK